MGDQGAGGTLSPFLRRTRFRAALPYIRGRVLDFGCGVGALANHVSQVDYLGVERDKASLTEASRRHPEHQFAEVWPPELRFDTVVALAVLEHLHDPLAFLRQARAALRPGGTIVLTTPHPAWEWVHSLGARVGLFSHEAHEEHEELLNREEIERLARAADLALAVYARFLAGANQLAVLRRTEGGSGLTRP